MGIISCLVAAIKAAFRWLTNIVRKIIYGILNFAREVVNWFKSLSLDPKRFSFHC